MMGIGKIGDAGVRLVSGFRWTFEGRNSDGETVFPPIGIRLGHRPAGWIGDADGLRLGGGELVFDEFFLEGHVPAQGLGIVAPSVASATITLHDSHGTKVESFHLTGLKAKSADAGIAEDRIEWAWNYEGGTYEAHTSAWKELT